MVAMLCISAMIVVAAALRMSELAQRSGVLADVLLALLACAVSLLAIFGHLLPLVF